MCRRGARGAGKLVCRAALPLTHTHFIYPQTPHRALSRARRTLCIAARRLCRRARTALFGAVQAIARYNKGCVRTFVLNVRRQSDRRCATQCTHDNTSRQQACESFASRGCAHPHVYTRVCPIRGTTIVLYCVCCTAAARLSLRPPRCRRTPTSFYPNKRHKRLITSEAAARRARCVPPACFIACGCGNAFVRRCLREPPPTFLAAPSAPRHLPACRGGGERHNVREKACLHAGSRAAQFTRVKLRRRQACHHV